MASPVFRATTFLFSVASYGIFLAVFLYLLAFLANLRAAPLVIDLGRDMGSVGLAVAIDLALLAVFGVQHSVMARPGFKRAWTRVVPKPMERSAYVLLSSVVLALLMWQWRPIALPVLWHADRWGIVVGWAIMGLGVAILLWATFLIDHFDLFGLRQGWTTLRGGELREPGFVTPWLYRIVRHPIYVGWFLIFWGTPTMTAGHLLFATVMSGYILVAIRFEERDLLTHIGEPYRRYREEVPALIPRPGRRYPAQVRTG
jgi:protein-S-isoprenylcysteine O-methyltransferase Ste14